MIAATRSATGPAPLLIELLELVPRPARLFPVLFRRAEREALPQIVFAGAAGVFIAYAAAQFLALGDRFGFAPTAITVLLLGTAIGEVGLYFAGGLLSWSADAIDGEADAGRMDAVVGYSAWPFLPLLAIVVPTELSLYGDAVFSAQRPEAPLAIAWGIRLLEAAAALIAATLIVRGTTVAARLSNLRAAEVIALSLLELGGIAALVLAVLVISFCY